MLDPNFVAVYLQGVRKGIDGMDDTEATRFGIFLNITLRFWENSYYQQRSHRLDPQLWNSIETQLSELTTAPGFAQYWPARKHFYSAEFQAYVEALEPATYRDPATAMRGLPSSS